MLNLNNKNIDHIFSDGAEMHDFEYNEQAWALMSDKLDQRDRRRRVLWALLFLLSALAIGYYFLSFNGSDGWNSISQLERTLPQTNAEVEKLDNSMPVESAKSDLSKEPIHSDSAPLSTWSNTQNRDVLLAEKPSDVDGVNTEFVSPEIMVHDVPSNNEKLGLNETKEKGSSNTLNKKDVQKQ